MDISLAWLGLDMRTVRGSKAIGARGCRRRGGTITVRFPPGVATRGMEWPDCARHPGAGPNQDPLALPATTAAVGAASAASSWPFSRSEEHTSELQSLMRISYAVFCLKKKKNKTKITEKPKKQLTSTNHN